MATGKKSSSTARNSRRKLSWDRSHNIGGKKDKRVEKSSHGKFKGREALEMHRKSLPRATPEERYEKIRAKTHRYKLSWSQIEHDDSLYNRVIHPEVKRAK